VIASAGINSLDDAKKCDVLMGAITSVTPNPSITPSSKLAGHKILGDPRLLQLQERNLEKVQGISQIAEKRRVII